MYKQKQAVKFLILSLILVVLASCLTLSKKDQIPPGITFDQNFKVVSPNQDGIQDELVLQFKINTKNFIRYWRIEILDENKNVVKIIGNTDDLEALKKKVFHKKENIKFPEKITWKGSDNKGKLLPDGKYYYRAIVMDNKELVTNTESIGLGYVYLDTNIPFADYKIVNKIFSPNDDGNKDQLQLSLDLNKDPIEDKYDELKGKDWNIDILNIQEELVKRIAYNDNNGLNTELQWNGTDNNNELVKDGIYLIKIHSTDQGGNYWEETINNVVVDTVQDPVEVIAQSGIFSPNGDSNNDTVGFDLSVLDTDNIVNWTFKIHSESMKEIKVFTGNETIDTNIIWDGKNENGEYITEGKYIGKFEVTYLNGNVSKAESAPFTSDLTAPSSESQISLDIFSPDGNGLKDNVVIKQKVSEEKTAWKASFYDKNKKEIRTYSWKVNIPSELKWDGTNEKNEKLPDGDYFYQLQCQDLAGNIYSSEIKKITIFTKKSVVSISPKYPVFSPNNDGVLDKQTFMLSAVVDENNPVTDWELNIYGNDDSIIFQTKDDGALPNDFIWNGIRDNKSNIMDGAYTAQITVNFDYGTTSIRRSSVFTADLTPPTILLTKNLKIFSPDDDGIDDQLFLTFNKAEDKNGIKKWKVEIINPFTDTEFISFQGTGTPKEKINWDGIGKNGNLVESVQEYPIKYIVEDNLGNIAEKNIDPILIDILVIKIGDDRYKIRISNINFLPDKAIMVSDDKNAEILDMLTKALKKFKDHVITVEGYANEYRKGLNVKRAQKLSQERADVISEELIGRGLSKDRINTVGKGFDNPIISLKDKMTVEEKKEMAINRRVEFYLQK